MTELKAPAAWIPGQALHEHSPVLRLLMVSPSLGRPPGQFLLEPHVQGSLGRWCAHIDSACRPPEEGPCLCSWTFQEPPRATDSQTEPEGNPKSSGGRWVIPPGGLLPLDSPHAHTPTPYVQLFLQGSRTKQTRIQPSR